LNDENMDKFMKHLEHNMPSEELIDKRRIMILAQILRKIDSIVKVPDQYQKLSYVLSEKYKGEFDFIKKHIYADVGFKFLSEGDKKMIKSRTFENDEEAEEYYKAVKKHLDKVVYEEKKKYELHPLGDNYYHEQFADDDSGKEWRQSQE
tara:strand:- start:4324 stop:4770 length:447 start_codon:yes stop_codon:yes gene_type:complete